MITAIVLAAGASRRLGRPKQLLDFDGTACLELVVRTCRASDTDRTVVVLGHRAARIAGACELGDAMVVVNDNYASGQTSSLKAGLEATEESLDAFLVFPVDHLLARVKDLNGILARFRTDPAPRAIVLPTCEGSHGHPALFGGAYRREILELPPDVGANTLVRQNAERIVEVETQNRWILFDIDTEEDYETALAEFRQRR